MSLSSLTINLKLAFPILFTFSSNIQVLLVWGLIKQTQTIKALISCNPSSLNRCKMDQDNHYSTFSFAMKRGYMNLFIQLIESNINIHSSIYSFKLFNNHYTYILSLFIFSLVWTLALAFEKCWRNLKRRNTTKITLNYSSSTPVNKLLFELPTKLWIKWNWYFHV